MDTTYSKETAKNVSGVGSSKKSATMSEYVRVGETFTRLLVQKVLTWPKMGCCSSYTAEREDEHRE